MKKTRKLQVAVASVLCATAAVAGFALMNPVQAQAAETETGVTTTFAMADGAYVRAVAGEAGIRWETDVTEAWYNANIPTGATVSFGTFVTGASKVTSIEDLTADNLSVDTYKIKDLACGATANFEEDGTFTYYSSIVYNNMSDWEDDEKLAAYATELIARSYVKYTLDGETKYIYADAEDTTRCMRAVALAAYEDESENGLTDTQKGVIDDYFATGATDALALTDTTDKYYETSVETDAFDVSNVTNNYTVAYAGAKRVGTFDKASGTVTLDESALGYEGVLTLFDADGNYAKTNSYKYVTQALEDLSALKTSSTTKISGYYVLKNDIALSGTWTNITTNFSGTLDGEGHTITGLSVTEGGLFNYLTGNATIKNVSVVDAQLNGSSTGVFAYSAGGNSSLTFDNVYVSLAHKTLFGEDDAPNQTVELNNHKYKGGFISSANNNGVNITVNNCVVYMPEFLSSAHGLVVAWGKPNLTITDSTFIGGNGEIVGTHGGSYASVQPTYTDRENSVVCGAVAAHQTYKANWTDMQKAAYEANHPYVELNQDNIADLANMTNQIVALTGDVTSSGSLSTLTFEGVFDGQSHKITITTVANERGGLFNGLRGSVKNVTVEGTLNGASGLVTRYSSIAYLENVYLKPTYTDNYQGGVAQRINPNTTLSMKNVVIETTNCVYDKNAAVVADCGTRNETLFGIYMENCHYIAHSEKPMSTRTGNYLNMNYYGTNYFWDIGDTVGGKTMTEDDGLMRYTDYTGLYASKLSGRVTLSEELNAMLPTVTEVTQDNYATVLIPDQTIDITGYFVLTEDIDLGNTARGLRPTFKGVLDGQGHTISGIDTTSLSNNQGGLFKYFDGTMKNVKIVGTLGGSKATGLIAGIASSKGNAYLENVYVEYNATGTGNNGALFRLVYNNYSLTMKNVVTYGTYTNQAKETGTMFAMLGDGKAALSGFKISMENCYGINLNANSAPLGFHTSTAYINSNNKMSDVFTIGTGENVDGTATTKTTYTLQSNTTITGSGSLTQYQGTDAKTVFDGLLNDGTITLTDYHKAWLADEKLFISNQIAPAYSILIPENASSEIVNAAKELRALVFESTKVDLPIVRDNTVQAYTSNMKVISLGDTTYAEANGVTVDKEDKDNFDYGYKIKTVDNSIFITAPTDYGVTFGVYGFLERQFNYDALSDEGYTIDQLGYSFFTEYNEVVEDDFNVRFATTYADEDAMRAMGYVTRSEVSMTSGSVHNTLSLIKYADYGEDHPDWFYTVSEFDWSSLSNIVYPKQLCYTAHGNESEYKELVQVAAEKLENYFKTHPENFIYLSQEDNTQYWCDCDTCEAWKDTYGSDSAAVIRFTNDVAAAIDAWMLTEEGKPYARDYKIGYLAYSQTLAPPFEALTENEDGTYSVNENFGGTMKWTTNLVKSHERTYSYTDIIPSEHTFPIYAPIGMKYQYAPDHAENEAFYSQIRGWQALTETSGMGVWNYFLNYSNYWLYYDSYTHMAELYKLYAEGNVIWFNEENANYSAWGALRNYLSAKLAKDADQDITKLTEKFFENYYGAAGEAMLNVFNATRAQFQTDAFLAEYLDDENEKGGGTMARIDDADLWSYDFALKAYNDINAALETEGLTAQQILNIRAERLSYEYMLIEYYASNFSAEDLLALKKQAKADADLNGIDTLASGGRNYKYTTNEAAEVWEAWGLTTTEETETAE